MQIIQQSTETKSDSKMTTYLASMADQRRGVAEFAAKMHLDIAPRNLRQRIPGLPITFRDDRDRDTAIIRLTEAKNAEIEASAWKRIFIWNSARGTRFSRKDVAAQLQSAVKSPRNLGLVEVLRDMLLAQQGDINYLRQRSSGWISLFVRPFQHEKRSQILASAAETGDISLVQLLVHHSDQSSLDEALELALPRSRNDRDLLIPELLLAHGADGSCQDEFLEAAVATHNTCLLELLIHAPKPVSREILSRNLLLAVRIGFIDTLFALVLAGADGNGSDGTGAAVKEAVKKGRQDILEALTLCDPAPTSQNLDEAVNIAYSKWIDEPLRQGTLMEILLKNGARGLYSDSTLLAISTHCVTQPSSPINSSLKEMMNLLVCHNASINHDNAAALNLCVSRTRIDLIDILLRSRHLDSNLASKAFSQIDSTASPQQNLEIASKLLQRGAHGRPLHEALIYAVATNHIGTIKLLLSRSNPNRASVDYQGAQALKDAVSREKIPIVDILLEAAPTNQSLSQTFPHIRKASKEGRFQLSKSFLKQGVQGLEVDRALSEAISDGPPMRDERLLQLLVDHRAAVDPHICSIVSRGDEILLRILLKGRPSVQVTSKAVLKALQLPEEDRRLSSICLLMNAGANINYDHGKAIFEATRSFQLPSLDLLLQFSPKPSSLNAAFASTTAMKDIERRYEYTRRLLKAGATGDEVHKALVAAVATTTPNLDLLKLIIPHASIDFEDGRALCLAIQKLLQQHVLLLLKMKPNSVSFSNGFSAARSLRDVQMELRFHKLLLAAGPEERVVSQTLLNAVEDQKTEVSRLLLKHGASTDFENGSSVVTAVTSTNALILKLLLGNSIRKPSVATVTTGFNAALRLRNGSPKQEILDIILNTGVKRDSRNNALLNFVKSDNPDCSTISTLLKHGASVYFNKNESLLVAAKRGNIEVLNLLFQFTNDTSVVSLVFADRFKDASFYTSRLGLCIMEMLLKNGAKGNQVNQALIKATEDYEKQSLAKDFAFILLQYGADVNFMNGNALQIAAGMGINATNLIVEILKKDCNAETLSLALPYLINSGNAVESTVTALIKQFASHRNQRFRKPFVHPEFSQPVIVLCFENFPRGLNLLMAVLDAGFPPDQTWQCRYGEQQVEITPLFWVLSKPDGVVDNILIEHLISRGGKSCSVFFSNYR
jgi:ankyrin repeat protein